MSISKAIDQFKERQTLDNLQAVKNAGGDLRKWDVAAQEWVMLGEFSLPIRFITLYGKDHDGQIAPYGIGAF